MQQRAAQLMNGLPEATAKASNSKSMDANLNKNNLDDVELELHKMLGLSLKDPRVPLPLKMQ